MPSSPRRDATSAVSSNGSGLLRTFLSAVGRLFISSAALISESLTADFSKLPFNSIR